MRPSLFLRKNSIKQYKNARINAKMNKMREVYAFLIRTCIRLTPL